ncbi:MAG: leucyl aminopeptidase [Chrysiogenetes bacterium]|nr:leucyl aminopeptidase [Chrysiogenetes bacterium]
MINPVEIAWEFSSPATLEDEAPAPVLLVGICDDGKPALIAPLEGSETETKIAALVQAAGFEAKRGQVQIVTSNADGLPGTLVLVGLGKRDRLDRLAVERGFAQAARKLRGGEFPAVAALPALGGEDLAEAIGPIIDGFVLGGYQCATYLPESRIKEAKPVEKVVIIVQGEIDELQRLAGIAQALADGANLARDLTNAPGADLTPPTFAEEVAKLAGPAGVQAEVWKVKRIAAHDMHLLLAVGQGSAEEPRVVKLSYKPEQRTSKTVVLVGKGITFDTGGIDLKRNPESIVGMKGDKGGAAAVIATLLACTKIKPACKVIGIIPMAENSISNKAIKPGDVFPSASGKSVEVADTDAEGRLILADALAYARSLEPDCIIDLATLTGSCMVGLGPQVAGLFCNDDGLAESVLMASDIAGERLWPLPLEILYRPELESEVADLRNIGERYGDAIHAALFLHEAVGDTPWAHLDIAGPAWLDSASASYPEGATGYGVRLLGNFLLGIE